jgi:hypothetical protein
MRIASCSSPRPITLKESAESVGSTRIDTLVSSSFSSRSLMFREVTQRPSRPAKGEVLTEKTIDSVGSSMCSAGSGAGISAEVMVSPMAMPSKPARATISPQSAPSTSTRFRPSKAYSLVTFVVTSRPSRLATPTVSPTRTRPEKMRPMPSRPR